ncbi:MAG: tRNA uridine-5-carboxymethylaminomethyl(34) synthesis GTPase MnmE [Lachnospiraceae bacterium]|nr:tRNA uridine-5-carboxymethylaminomethyl(34) synthesis GTPase MnmE [Lachnospiraceae bacterium]
MKQDTIAAIATGMTSAGIGIIRVSGTEAIDIIDRIYLSKNGRKASELEDHKLCLGDIMSPKGEKFDEVLLSVMRAPHSYTGENTVEINCHGGIYLCARVLALVLASGARIAEPGEFTKRAFLNGKMDLSQAEAVMDLIRSENDFAAKNALRQVEGAVYERISSLREKILHELAYIEAALDDPEHYDLTDYPEELDGKVCDFIEEIEKILLVSKNGRIRKEGIRTAILGKPNAGKSSVLNLLAGHESAIVTDIAGTTRDAIEESVRLGELQLNLIDTAGIRDTEDKVEQIGVEKAIRIADDADLIFFVADSSAPIDENDIQIADRIKDKRIILLYNKTDLHSLTSPEDMLRLFSDKAGEAGKRYPLIPISAKNGEGLVDLQRTLEEMFLSSVSFLNEDLILTNLRQLEELRLAKESLYLVLNAIRSFMTEDIFAIDLSDSYKHLGYIIGEEMGDDLADKIFSEFCMGK